MLKMNAREAALYEVQAVGFALYDANLYLDTHPNDTNALAAMKEYQQKYAAAKAKYEQCYGPLTVDVSGNDEYWLWAKGPWPWQLEA